MRRNDKIMIVESLYRDQAAFFGLGAPSQVQLFMQRRFKKENYKKNKEERKNLPSQTIQPFQTREKSNPHCHSIYQAQCLHFSPCKQESNLFSKRCTRYKRPSLHLFQENNWASKIKKENENWKTGNGSLPAPRDGHSLPYPVLPEAQQIVQLPQYKSNQNPNLH